MCTPRNIASIKTLAREESTRRRIFHPKTHSFLITLGLSLTLAEHVSRCSPSRNRHPPSCVKSRSSSSSYRGAMVMVVKGGRWEKVWKLNINLTCGEIRVAIFASAARKNYRDYNTATASNHHRHHYCFCQPASSDCQTMFLFPVCFSPVAMLLLFNFKLN